jgi:peptidoglycan/LPS O-acetylase OafA/YrhL
VITGSGPARPASIPHAPALDGLRGLAVLAVLAFHAGHLPGGYLGVDLFFVLSGYLITRLLLAEWSSTGGVRLGAFWGRRFRRLLPALLVVLVAVLAYAALLADPAELTRIRRDAVATVLYLANWEALSAGRDYWALFDAPSPLEHMWSLAIEEQFYVVWPLVVVGLLRVSGGSRRLLLGVALVGAVAAATLGVVIGSSDGARAYLGTDTRAASILAGAALGVVVSRSGWSWATRHPRALAGAGWIAAVALGTAWIALDGASPWLWRGGMAACGLAAVVLIAATAGPESGTLGRLLANPILRWFGLISYGLYLWHWPVYVVLDADRTGLTDPALTVVRVAVSIALAVVSFRVVERPIRTGTVRIPRPRLAAPLAGAAVIGLALVVTAPAPDVAADLPGAAGDDIRAERVVVEPVATADVPPTIVVVGDDAAADLVPVLAAGTGADDPVVVDGSSPGCGLVRPDVAIDPADVACADPLDRWVEAATAAEADIVLVVIGGDVDLRARIGEAELGPCAPDFDAWYRLRSVDMVEGLAATGAVVAVASVVDPTHVPGPDEAPEACLNNTYRRATLGSAVSTFVELGPWLCPGGACRPIEDTGLDPTVAGMRFATPGAEATASWLTDQVLAIERPQGAPTDVVVLGDSTALRLAQGFRPELVDVPVVFGYETRLGCSVLPADPVLAGGVLVNERCRGLLESWWGHLDRSAPDVAVLLIGAWELFDQQTLDGRRVTFGTAAWDELVLDGLRATLGGLAARSERVVALATACFDQPGGGDYRLEDRSDPARTARFNQHLRTAAAESGVEVLPLDELLCPAGVYRNEVEGVTMRYDGVHLSPDGAGLVWQWLLDQLGDGLSPTGPPTGG